MEIIDAEAIVGFITASTTSYMVEFSPIFVFIGGIILAVGVVAILIDVFFPQRYPQVDFDYAKADELRAFYSRRGRTDGPYDYTKMHDQ